MRRKVKIKKHLKEDPLYNSALLSQFINKLMWDGKKTIAVKTAYLALEEIKKQTKKDPLEVFKTAIENVSPSLEVISRRVGGANYQVPREVRATRKTTLAMRWIIGAARAKSGSPMHKRLADELVAASKKEGDAYKKKETVHKMAEANKAFAHFAW